MPRNVPIVLCLLAARLAAAGQTTPAPAAQPSAQKLATARGPDSQGISGANEYRTHCANCHGADGKGDGPFAEKLQVSAKK